MPISLIWRENLIRRLENKEKILRMHSLNMKADGVKLAIEELKNSYVEVVHCEECYYWNKDTRICKFRNITRVADDFCSDGVWRVKVEAQREILKKMGDNMK